MPGPQNALCPFIHKELSAREADFRDFCKYKEQDLQEQISLIFFLWMRMTLSLGYSGESSKTGAGYVWAPYTKWFSNISTGEVLVDYIVRFEDDDATLGCSGATRSSLLCMLGVQFSNKEVTLHENNSSSGVLLPGIPQEFLSALSKYNYRHWYTPLGRSLVESIFAEDLLTFDYEF